MAQGSRCKQSTTVPPSSGGRDQSLGNWDNRNRRNLRDRHRRGGSCIARRPQTPVRGDPRDPQVLAQRLGCACPGRNYPRSAREQLLQGWRTNRSCGASRLGDVGGTFITGFKLRLQEGCALGVRPALQCQRSSSPAPTKPEAKSFKSLRGQSVKASPAKLGRLGK